MTITLRGTFNVILTRWFGGILYASSGRSGGSRGRVPLEWSPTILGAHDICVKYVTERTFFSVKLHLMWVWYNYNVTDLGLCNNELTLLRRDPNQLVPYPLILVLESFKLPTRTLRCSSWRGDVLHLVWIICFWVSWSWVWLDFSEEHFIGSCTPCVGL